MGCDIHMFIEYGNAETNKQRKKDGKEEYWMSFGGGFNPGRNYILFGYLAGVRYEPEGALTPKGLPEIDTLGYQARSESLLYITEDGEGEGETTLEKALKWVENYGEKIIYRDEKPLWVTHPDWHSHSWLTTKEFEDILNLYLKDKDNWGGALEYFALLSAMKTLDADGQNNVRIVFWFDN